MRDVLWGEGLGAELPPPRGRPRQLLRLLPVDRRRGTVGARQVRAHDLELTDDARYALLLDAERHIPARTDIYMAPSTDTPWRSH